MGCFNYRCSLRCSPGCYENTAENGQDSHMMNTSCYAVNSGRKWKVHYGGFGSCSISGTESCLYDLSHQDFFSCWDVKEDDMRAYLACPVCATSLYEEVNSYEDLMRAETQAEPSAETQAEPSAKAQAEPSAEAQEKPSAEAQAERVQARLAAAQKQVVEMERKRNRYVAPMESLDEKLVKKQARVQMLEGKCGKGPPD